jgi:hypothetical protein
MKGKSSNMAVLLRGFRMRARARVIRRIARVLVELDTLSAVRR